MHTLQCSLKVVCLCVYACGYQLELLAVVGTPAKADTASATAVC